MRIVKKIAIKESAFNGFADLLQEEFILKMNPFAAINWAYSRLKPRTTLIQRNFPEVVLVGQEELDEGMDFVQEKFLGHLVAIQSGYVVFFPGDTTLYNSKIGDYCGRATFLNGRLNIYGPKLDNCETSVKDGQKYFIIHFGVSYESYDRRYRLTDEMFEKIKKIFEVEF